jgi:hypothetical protein
VGVVGCRMGIEMCCVGWTGEDSQLWYSGEMLGVNGDIPANPTRFVLFVVEGVR